ncbi:Phototropic-responsive NPH3 family protein [Euphorbia peplus]|nr:Phototropic-responsive NPH3 family protein [Euphorbia peplus]
MKSGCYCKLKLDVNGNTFTADNKKVPECFSGKFRKLHKLKGKENRLKVTYANKLELLSSFCCNINAGIDTTPSNLILLISAAYFMGIQISNSNSILSNFNKTFLDQETTEWNFSELVEALKQCQNLLPAKNPPFLLQKISDSFTFRLASIVISTPFPCSSSLQCSSDSSSTTRIGSSTHWWFEELVFLNARFFDKLVRHMVFLKLDHSIILKFIIFYFKSRLLTLSTQAERHKIVEVVIDLLVLLDRKNLSCKALFEILRIVMRLQRIKKCSKLKLERLIGSKLDQVTIDQLLIPSREYSAYDVNLVLRLVEAYVLESWMVFPDRIKKVGSLIDSYLMEVAADFRLRPSKFAALLMVLPDSARESNDKLYRAIDLYLQVHTELREEETIRLCCALNHEKLSPEALKHLAGNSKFLGRQAVQDFVVDLQEYDLKKKNVMSKKKYARKHKHLTKFGHLDKDLQQMESKSMKMSNVMALPIVCNKAKSRYLPKFCK